MKKDGWILVQHPDMGLLLQALSGDVEEIEAPLPNPPEGWKWCGSVEENLNQQKALL